MYLSIDSALNNQIRFSVPKLCDAFDCHRPVASTAPKFLGIDLSLILLFCITDVTQKCFDHAKICKRAVELLRETDGIRPACPRREMNDEASTQRELRIKVRCLQYIDIDTSLSI